jgi:hypothetical protein
MEEQMTIGTWDGNRYPKRVQKFRIYGLAKSKGVNARGDAIDDSTAVSFDDLVPVYVDHLTSRRVGSCTLHRGPRGIMARGVITLDEGWDAEVIAKLKQMKLSIGSQQFAGEDYAPIGLGGRRILRRLHITEISLTMEPADKLTELSTERIFN